MTQKPKGILNYLHGDSATPVDVGFTYAAALLGVAVVGLLSGETSLRFGLVSRMILAGTAADLFGGAVANFTRSTNGWYWRGSAKLRLVFLFVHAFQPAVIALAVSPESGTFLLASYLWMLGTAFLIVGLRKRQHQLPLAVFLTLAGSVGLPVFFKPALFLAWFAPVYLTKLDLGFSVNHWDIIDAENRRP